MVLFHSFKKFVKITGRINIHIHFLKDEYEKFMLWSKISCIQNQNKQIPEPYCADIKANKLVCYILFRYHIKCDKFIKSLEPKSNRNKRDQFALKRRADIKRPNSLAPRPRARRPISLQIKPNITTSYNGRKRPKDHKNATKKTQPLNH